MRAVTAFLALLACMNLASADESSSGGSTLAFTVLAVRDHSGPVLTNGANSTVGFSADAGFGAGGLVSLRLPGAYQLVSGLIYSDRKWEDDANGTVHMGLIELPLYLRYRLFSFLAIDGGGYYTRNNVGPVLYYVAKHDYGLVAGGELSIPVGQSTALVAGAHYLYGLYSVSAVGGSLAMRDFQLSVGLQFGR